MFGKRVGAMSSHWPARSTSYNMSIEQLNRQAEAAEQPVVTQHARDRWIQRKLTKFAVSPEVAWRRAIDVTAPTVSADSVRLYQPEDLLLVERENHIVTVLEADYSRLEVTAEDATVTDPRMACPPTARGRGQIRRGGGT